MTASGWIRTWAATGHAMICSNGAERPLLNCIMTEDEAGHEQATGRRDATVGAEIVQKCHPTGATTLGVSIRVRYDDGLRVKDGRPLLL